MSNETNSYRFSIADARLAFPNLFKAKAGPDGGEPSFSAALIIPPNHPIIPKLNAAFERLAKEKWGEKGPAIVKQLRAQDRLALHDGATKAGYAGYDGNMFINTRSKMRPTVVDRNKVPLSEEDGKVYAGCYVNVSLELWAQDNNYGKRVNATLMGVQFFRDGDAFAGGGVAGDDDFDDVSIGATADDLA